MLALEFNLLSIQAVCQVHLFLYKMGVSQSLDSTDSSEPHRFAPTQHKTEIDSAVRKVYNDTDRITCVWLYGDKKVDHSWIVGEIQATVPKQVRTYYFCATKSKKLILLSFTATQKQAIDEGKLTSHPIILRQSTVTGKSVLDVCVFVDQMRGDFTAAKANEHEFVRALWYNLTHKH